MMLSDKIQKIKPSPTLAITSKAKAMKAAGEDVIGFGAGEPDFNTPDNICQAAIKAIQEGFTKYCPSGGTLELKKAVVNRLKADYNLDYTPDNVVISCGGKHVLYNLFQCTLNKKDEVIIPSPYWVSYPDMVVLADGRPKIIKTKQSNDFKMTPGQLAKAINKKTKAVIINSPSNPTGAAYNKEELAALVNVAIEKNIFIISDDIYEKLVYGDFTFTSIPTLSEKAKEMTLIVSGVSKTYSMTGWRIGYLAGNAEIVKAITKLQSQSTSNPTSISMKAAVEALNGPQEKIAEMKQEFEKRRNYMVKRLNKIKGIKCFMPLGSFYTFPNIKRLFGKKYGDKTITCSDEFAAYLLNTVKVAVVPGEGFGADGFMRLSYATSMENIQKGLDRIEEAVKKLS